MKSEQVNRAWEFYRDNCDGFKEPMRKEMRKLDDYVASVESENAKLHEEIEVTGLVAYVQGRKQLIAENAKLRELVRELYEDQCCDGDQWKYRDRMHELGIEAD